MQLQFPIAEHAQLRQHLVFFCLDFLGPVTHALNDATGGGTWPGTGADDNDNDDKSQSLHRNAHSSLDPRVTCNG